MSASSLSPSSSLESISSIASNLLVPPKEDDGIPVLDQDGLNQVNKLTKYLETDVPLRIRQRLRSYSENQMKYLADIILCIILHFGQNEEMNCESFAKDPSTHRVFSSRLATLAVMSRTTEWTHEEAEACEQAFSGSIPEIKFDFHVPRDVIDEYFDITFGWSQHEVGAKERIMATTYFQENLEIADGFDITQDSHFYRDWMMCSQVALLIEEKYNIIPPTIMQLIYVRRELLRFAMPIIAGMERVFFRLVRVEFEANNLPFDLDIGSMCTSMMVSYVDFPDSPDMSESRVRWAVLIQMIRDDIKRDLMAGVGRGPISHKSFKMLDMLARVYQKALLAPLV